MLNNRVTFLISAQELQEEMRKHGEEEAKKEDVKRRKKEEEKKQMIKGYHSEKQKKRKIWIKETKKRFVNERQRFDKYERSCM